MLFKWPEKNVIQVIPSHIVKVNCISFISKAATQRLFIKLGFINWFLYVTVRVNKLQEHDRKYYNKLLAKMVIPLVFFKLNFFARR